MIYLCNGKSESMKRDPYMKDIPYPLTEAEFIKLIHDSNFKSCIGHESLANCLSKITGKEIRYNRTSVSVSYEDIILLVSLNGRLPEHPNFVEYHGRLNYSLIRFEKQNQIDIENSANKFKQLLMEEI